MSQIVAGDSSGIGVPPAVPIVALPPIPTATAALSIDPKTGEPPHVPTVRAAYGLFLVAAAAQVVSLALAWLRAISMSTFDDATRPLQWVYPRPGGVASIVLAVALVVVGVLLVATPVLTGYLAWVGHKAAIWWGLATFVLSWATLFTTAYPIAVNLANVGWLAVPFSLVGAALLWLPASRAGLDAWHRFRHPAPPVPAVRRPIAYGRLEQYR